MGGGRRRGREGDLRREGSKAQAHARHFFGFFVDFFGDFGEMREVEGEAGVRRERRGDLLGDFWFADKPTSLNKLQME